jgi:hypothetical protein
MSIVFLRPSYEELTQVVSSYLKLAVDNARRLGFNVYDLYGDEATWENFSESLLQFNPYVVSLGTHGQSNIIYGQNGIPVLTGCVNDEVLSGRVVFALACQTATSLGPSSVSKGCAVYFGWIADYVILMDDSYPPLQDPYAASFLRPILVGLDVLFRDVLAQMEVQNLAKHVYESVISAFNDEIAYWRVVPTPTASQMLTYLIHDRDTFVPVTATGIYTPPTMVTVQMPFTSLIAVGLLALPLFLKVLSPQV